LSVDGEHWVKVADLVGGFVGGGFDLDPILEQAAAGGSDHSNVQIKFQQYDNYAATSDGREFDNILVTGVDAGSTLLTIGTGTSAWKYPMYTWYHDSRTQVIYLADEIGVAGSITALGLYVIEAPAMAMGNWTIRMKHTGMSAYGAPSLDASGWTVVVSGR